MNLSKNGARRLAWTIMGVALTVIQGLAQSIYEPYTFTTLAGSASGGSEDGIGSNAHFGWDGLSGVAVDGAGNVYVSDTYNQNIRKVTPTGVVTTLAGNASITNEFGTPLGGYADGMGSTARFNYPLGIATDNAGNVYVADSGNNMIRKITQAGVVTTLAGTPLGGYADGTGTNAMFNLPHGIAADNDGNVYVADSGNNTIRKITRARAVTTLAGDASITNEFGILLGGYADGMGSDARFNGPWGVAVSSWGAVYVADTRNRTIRIVTPDGMVTTMAGNASVGGSADGLGSEARFGGSGGLGCSAVPGPKGVAVDGAGNVYVTDSYNFTIRKVTLNSGRQWAVTTLAGLARNDGSTDGTGSDARFGMMCVEGGTAGPTGVAVDSAGNIYVADTDNKTIRKGYPALRIHTPGFNSSQFGFYLTGPSDRLVVVEGSADLVNWLSLSTNNFAADGLNFSDPPSGTSSNRFYRARLQ